MKRNTSRKAEEAYLAETLRVVRDNVREYGQEIAKMQEDIDEMLEHYHDNDAEVLTILNNTVTMHTHMKRALERNEKALKKPYFGRIVFHDEALNKEESLYIGRGGIAKDTTHQMVTDWRAPVANAYYENGLGKCSYPVPDGQHMEIELLLKRTYEIEDAKLIDYYDSEVVANDELLTRYLAKNKKAVLGEIIATIQQEQNEIIRKSPYHSMIVQGVAGSGKTTVAMHRISYILYNYEERFQPEDFYIVGSNRILLDYITGVLPDLDVYGIRQMTMEQLFVRLLYEDWDETYRICPVRDAGKNGAVRGTLAWFEKLQKFCSRVEWNTIPRTTVLFNRKQFVEGLRDGRVGVFDESGGKNDPKDMVVLMTGEAIERYIRQNPSVSAQSKVLMLQERLMGKVEDEFLGKGISYTLEEKKAIRRSMRKRFGARQWKKSVYEMYHDFLTEQKQQGVCVEEPQEELDVYDLAALAYLYRRMRETEVISEAHHIVVDEAQDFGVMVYAVLKECVRSCTYTVMGDVSQNIRMDYGISDWEGVKNILLTGERDNFCVLRKSYRNTVEIANFASDILAHGEFPGYGAEPVIRHGEAVGIRQTAGRDLYREAAKICKGWQTDGFDTIAVICRDQKQAQETAELLQKELPVMPWDPEKASFEKGIMVFPVEYTKGLEFDAVLLLSPDRESYPIDDGHAKLLYVAATRALHRLEVLHTGNLTGLIADPIPKKNKKRVSGAKKKVVIVQNPSGGQEAPLPYGTDAMQESADARRAGGKTQGSARPAAAAPRPTSAGAGWTSRPKPVISGQPQKALHPLASLYGSNSQTAQGYGRAVGNRQSAQAAGRTVNGTVQPRVTGDMHAYTASGVLSFGELPDTAKLRAAGHAKIDHSIRWVQRKEDGLYLQSRYGVTRLSPVGSGILRVTFSRGEMPPVHPAIAVTRVEKNWQMREKPTLVEMRTPEMYVVADKKTGALRFLDKDSEILLEESRQDRCLIENAPNGGRSRLFFDWKKGEGLYAAGALGKGGIHLEKTARCISHGVENELPYLISDRGYGILSASSKEVIFCSLPVYGNQICLEGTQQPDYYIIVGKKLETLLKACAYLCGKL